MENKFLRKELGKFIGDPNVVLPHVEELERMFNIPGMKVP